MAQFISMESENNFHEEKGNILSEITQLFLSLDTMTKFGIFTLLVMSISTAAIVNLNLFSTERLTNTAKASPETIEKSVKAKTLALLTLAKEYKTAVPTRKASLMRDISVTLLSRKLAFLSLMKVNPHAALALVLPQETLPMDIELGELNREKQVTLEGTVKVLQTDNFESKNAQRFYILQTSDQRVSLYFTSPPSIPSGTHIKVTGTQLDTSMLVDMDNSQNLQVLQTLPSVLGATTVKKVGVLLFNFENQPKTLTTPEKIQDALFLSQNSAKKYFDEISYQTLKIEGIKDTDSGDVYGPFTIDVKNETHFCSYEDIINWATKVEEAASRNSIDLTGYTSIILFSPTSKVCENFEVASEVSGKYIWINGLVSPDIFVHMLGHSFGINHESTLSCTNQAHCVTDEYGDPFGSMGVFNFRHINAYHKGQLGFFSEKNIQTITSSGTYQVAPLETLTNTPMVLRIPKGLNPVTNAQEYFYIEYRTPFGFDSFAPTDPVVQGISIRVAQAYQSYGQSYLLDTTPETPTFQDSSLTVGRTYTDLASGIQIATRSISPQGANIQINVVPKQCVSSDPLVILTPLGQWLSAGQTANINVLIKNTDSSGCPPSAFTLDTSLPEKWTDQAHSTVTIAPGASSTMTLSIKSPFDTKSDYYSFDVKVAQASSQTPVTASANINILP